MSARSPASSPARSPRVIGRSRSSSQTPNFSPPLSPIGWLPPAPPAPPTPEVAHRRFVSNLMHAVQLLLQSLVVICLLGVITYMTFNASEDLEHWTWLWHYASPALVLLFSVCFTSLLIHEVDCLSIGAHLWFQGGCFVLASFAAALLVRSCTHADRDDHGKFSVGFILGMTVVMWAVFFMGFLQAAFVWWREQRAMKAYLKGKRIQIRGASAANAYGTFSDDGMDGIDGLVQGSP